MTDRPRAGISTRHRVGGLAGAIVALLALNTRDVRPARKKQRRCEKLRTRCNSDDDRQVCCGALTCQSIAGMSGDRCCKSRFAPCTADNDCCANLECVGVGRGFCDILAVSA